MASKHSFPSDQKGIYTENKTKKTQAIWGKLTAPTKAINTHKKCIINQDNRNGAECVCSRSRHNEP